MSTRQQELEEARKTLVAAGQKVRDMEAKLSFKNNPKELNFEHMMSELSDLKRDRSLAAELVGELELGGSLDRKNANEMLVWMTTLSPDSPGAKARQELAAWQRREDFLETHTQEISKLFSGPDYYNQAEVTILDMILVEDAKSVGDNPSNFTEEELAHMAAKAQSGNPELIIGEPTQKLLDTKRVLVDSYAAIKFGEKYDPATLDKIIQDYGSVKGKDGKPLYSFVKEAEEYYAKHNIKLLENGDVYICQTEKDGKNPPRCELRKFHTYTKEDLLVQLHVMKNMDPEVKRELKQYRSENGLNPETGERIKGLADSDAKPKFGSMQITRISKPGSLEAQIAELAPLQNIKLKDVPLTKKAPNSEARGFVIAVGPNGEILEGNQIRERETLKQFGTLSADTGEKGVPPTAVNNKSSSPSVNKSTEANPISEKTSANTQPKAAKELPVQPQTQVSMPALP